MSRSDATKALNFAAEPRAHLLPPEVGRERAGRAIRRRLGFGVVLAVLVVAVGVAGATLLAIQAQASLVAEQDRTTDLLQQQGEFIEVRNVQQQVGLIEAAQQVGVSTEIDWKSYLNSVQATLPASVTITAVDVESSTPMAVYAQPTTPLQGSRVATISFTATSSVLPDVPAWLTSLATLPGYADALPGSVQLDSTSGVYTANITMHVNSDAFSKRFSTDEGK